MKTDLPCDLIGKLERFAAAFLFILISQTALCDIIPASRIITWQGNVGIPGGVPTNRVVFTNLSAGATVAQIQSALNACPSNKVVVLPAGTNTITGTLVIPSFVTLRGAGMGQTVLNCTGSGQSAVRFGTEVQGEYVATAHNMTSGYTKGSTNIVLNNVTGMAVGSLLVLDELNDANLPVSNVGTYGTINWNSRTNGTRALGQTVEVKAINGTTVTFWPPMYWTYLSSLTPQALHFTAGCQWAGLENVTLRANSSGYSTMFYMAGSKYCWVKAIENDYCDGDHGEIGYGSYRCEVRDSFFHDAYNHNSGTTDSDLMIHSKSSGILVENNIFYRLHTSVMLNWGASGNVIAYNYSSGNFHQPAPNFMIQDLNGNHGAHPMFNLFEGNIGNSYHPDSFWGSSSHGTSLRNWFRGAALIMPPYTGRGAYDTSGAHYANQACGAVIEDFAISYGNDIGNIIGSPWASSTNGAVYMALWPANRGYGTTYMWSLGYSDSSDGGSDTKDSALPYTTGLRHGNYDFVSKTQKWDTNYADHVIPNSYYLAGKPAFFGTLNWPAFDPSNVATANVTNIPAGYRFTYGVNPPSTGSQPPPPSGWGASESGWASGWGAPTNVVTAVGTAIPFQYTGPGSTNCIIEFGDGTSSTSNPAAHAYSSAGTFLIYLDIIQANGTTNRLQKDTVIVK
jgi:hypothetical protein